MAAPVKLEAHKTVYMHQADTRRLRFTILNGTGAAKNLSGLVANVQWNLYLECSTPGLLPKSLGSGITVYNAAAGQIMVTLDSPDTELMAPGAYMDELRIEYWTGEEEVVAYGFIMIRDRRVGEVTPV